MTIHVRKEVCSTCPWRTENGHQLEIDTIRRMMLDGTISPCHQELEKVTGSCTTGVEEYAAKVRTFKVCRGLAIAREKLMPFTDSGLWNDLNEEVEDAEGEPDLVAMKDVIYGNIGH